MCARQNCWDIPTFPRHKNLMFAASKDGLLCVFKLPPEWGPKWIDEKLRELRMAKGAGGFKNW